MSQSDSTTNSIVDSVYPVHVVEVVMKNDLHEANPFDENSVFLEDILLMTKRLMQAVDCTNEVLNMLNHLRGFCDSGKI